LHQERIWDHFQTARVDSFGAAAGRYAAMARHVRRHVGGPSRARVLNIGIGSGALERRLKAQGWTVSALDPSAAAVHALQAVGIDAHVGYAQAMPFADASFDGVIASEVLEHLTPQLREAVLPEVRRVMRPGGWFMGSVPYREVLSEGEVICPDCGKVFHRWGHVSSFDSPSLRAELSRVFVDIRCNRRSFVDWASARSPMRLVKAVAQSLLGRLGEPIASPSIIFAARRSQG
jgi:SAM-dependent methyltransferase